MSTASSLADALRTAEAFFDALRRAEWTEAATTVDSEAVAEFRRSHLAYLVSWAQRRVPLSQMREEAWDAVSWSSDGRLDSALLEKVGATPLRAIPGVRTLAELAAMTPLEFVAKYLEVGNAPADASTRGPKDRALRRVLGGVAEGETVAHVLYRNEGAGVELSDPYHVDLLRLKQRDQVWRIDLTTFAHELINDAVLQQVSGPFGDTATDMGILRASDDAR